MNNPIGRILTTAFLGAALFAAPLAAADYVILESDAEGIEPGIVVSGDAQISIPSGANVVMIDPDGQTRLVTGPYAGVVADAGGAEDASAIEKFTSSRDRDTKVLGAVRSFTFEGGSVSE